MIYTITITLCLYFTTFFNDALQVEATCYQPVASQTDSSPLTTASLKKINPDNPLSHRWIAVSSDLELMGYSFGTKVHVSGTCVYDGIWVVQDRMNSRWRKRIDFLVGLDDYIDKWDNVTISKL